jgi:hypothetical protein
MAASNHSKTMVELRIVSFVGVLMNRKKVLEPKSQVISQPELNLMLRIFECSLLCVGLLSALFSSVGTTKIETGPKLCS